MASLVPNNIKLKDTMMYSSRSSLANDEKYLPEDLITEILLLLPIKSLLRFKSVCKYWKSLITSSKFATLQLQYSNKHLPACLVVRSDNTIVSLNSSLNPYGNTNDIVGKFVPIPSRFLLEKCSLHLIGTCHGLLCIYMFNRDDNSISNIYLWNPVINQLRLIRPPPKNNHIILRAHESGFGYVPSTKDYKIILFTNPVITAQVYSVRNDRWKEVSIRREFIFPKKNNIQRYLSKEKPHPAVQLNESLYWSIDSFITRFDLVHEVFEKVSDLKDHGIISNNDLVSLQKCIGVTKENKLCVCLLKAKERGKPHSLETWVLDKGRENHWEPLYKQQGSFRDIGDDHELLGFAFDCRVVVMAKRRTNMEVSLILDARQYPPLFVHSSNEYCPPYKRGISTKCVMSYVQSLVSPFSI